VQPIKIVTPIRWWAIAGCAVALACQGAAEPNQNGLSPEERRVVERAAERAEQAVALLEWAVNIPSATQNLAGVRAVGALFRAELEPLGFQTRWVDMPAAMHRAGHLIADHPGTQGKRLLLIGHLDTVLEGKPFVRRGARAEGNGTVDMKAGDVILIAALQALHDCGALDQRQVIVVLTGDEEDTGLPIAQSRADLLDAARRSDIALAFEAVVDAKATVARRGVGNWRLRVRAPGGHSSDVRRSPGAVFDTARILEAFRQELADEPGLSINPALILGGTTVTHDAAAAAGSAEGKANVIAGESIATGDLRFLSDEQKQRAQTRMSAIVGRHLPRTSGEITFTDEYPAMAPKPENYAVLSVLDQASRDLGFGPVGALAPEARGAGDLSFVAALVAGLDGLGASGGGSHRADEHVDLASLPRQIQRAALLMYRLTRGGTGRE
jgi:glutamate carboxypeptidase